MAQHTKALVESAINKTKILYSVGIGANLFISVGHIAYTFVAYDMLDEPALWFFSGALATIFNAALNFLCLRECTKLNHVIAMTVNVALLVFSVVLVIVIRETQTVCFAVTVACTAAFGYYHNRHMLKRKFDLTIA